VTAAHVPKPGTTRLQIEVDAPTGAVWAVLSDPETYPDFVPGAKYERDHDPEWPAVGAKLHHTIGFGPLVLRDATTVEAVDPGSCLTLSAGMSVLGVSAVRFTVEPMDDRRSRVGIEEWPLHGPIDKTWNRVFDGMMTARNQELLRRLRDIVQQRAFSPR
jgi:carbon monoxide dehydrogenase subunit G